MEQIIEFLSKWGGVAGTISSFVAIIVVFVIWGNITSIFSKNRILMQENFDIKKQAIQNSLDAVDYIAMYGADVKSNIEFTNKSKKIYNDLLCVVSNEILLREFFLIAVDSKMKALSMERINKYKLMCRKEIGLKTKTLSKN